MTKRNKPNGAERRARRAQRKGAEPSSPTTETTQVKHSVCSKCSRYRQVMLPARLCEKCLQKLAQEQEQSDEQANAWLYGQEPAPDGYQHAEELA